MKKKPENAGLALGGGAVLGAAHIGILKALEELDIKISYIAGTSVGALISAFYAFGKGWKEMEAIMKEFKWLDASGINLSRYALLSNKKLGDMVVKNLGDVNFESSEIPLAMVSADITTGEKIIMKEGRVAKAVMASTCVPGVYKPVKLNGRMLVDGGIIENVPISPLKDMGADYIIAVNLISKNSYKKPVNIIEVLLNAFRITIINTSKIQSAEADLLIAPDLSDFNLIDTGQVELIDKGYEEAKKVFKVEG